MTAMEKVMATKISVGTTPKSASSKKTMTGFKSGDAIRKEVAAVFIVVGVYYIVIIYGSGIL